MLRTLLAATLHGVLGLSLAVVTINVATMPDAHAQVRIDVSGVGATQYPIAVANFTSDGKLPQDVVNVIRSDLTRSGQFKLIDPQTTLGENAQINATDLRGRGADSVLGGSINRLPDGRYEIRFRLTDVVRQQAIAGESVIATEADLRYAAHRVADIVFEKITGDKGIFATRIAYISKAGSRYKLNVADWDGENVQSPLTSTEPIISPAWSPDGNRLAYVSFESRKPVVYVHTLSTGQRQAVANFKGSNSAPAWSPDGHRLAVTLTTDGLSQMYLIDATGGTPRKITSSSAIDTEPAFSPDGRSIYFTSDRGGSPQIYRVSVGGGDPTRITFGNSYNVSPRVSPDGKLLAFVTRKGGGFFIATKNLTGGGAEQTLSDGGREESPSFAPNGKWIMYATTGGGRDTLMLVTTDGRVKQRLTSSLGDIREPTWGPFPK